MDPAALVAMAVKQLGVDVPTTQNLMRIGITLAQDVNKAKDLPGRAKLDLVVRALRGLLEEPTVRERLSPEVAATLQSVVQDVIPETISLVVEASRGAFQLKKPTVGCVAGVLALLCRQAAAHAPGEIGKAASQMAEMAKVVSDNATPVVPEDTTLTLRTPDLEEKK
jgi:hypothetical protein